jgi:hypothetical protein
VEQDLPRLGAPWLSLPQRQSESDLVLFFVLVESFTGGEGPWPDRRNLVLRQSIVSDTQVDAVLALMDGDARETIRMLLQERARLIALISHGYVRGCFGKEPHLR